MNSNFVKTLHRNCNEKVNLQYDERSLVAGLWPLFLLRECLKVSHPNIEYKIRRWNLLGKPNRQSWQYKAEIQNTNTKINSESAKHFRITSYSAMDTDPLLFEAFIYELLAINMELLDSYDDEDYNNMHGRSQPDRAANFYRQTKQLYDVYFSANLK